MYSSVHILLIPLYRRSKEKNKPDVNFFKSPLKQFIHHFTIMTGELAALGASLLWAVASIIFADIGRHIHAVNLNLIKGLFACLLMFFLLLFGSLLDFTSLNLASLFSLSNKELLLLGISGVIGIGVGDTAYFACIRRIGAQKGLMLESTAPVLAALLALLFFQETLSLNSWMGILVTSTGVILVVKWSRAAFSYSTTAIGVLFGLLAAFCQASGIVISRKVFLSGDIDPLTSGLVRLSAALLSIAVWLLLKKLLSPGKVAHQSTRSAMRLLIDHKLLIRLIGAITLGTFLAIWLMQTSVKFTSAGITQTLLATCPLFGMVIGRLQGQKQPAAVWFGLSLGVVGVSLLFL